MKFTKVSKPILLPLLILILTFTYESLASSMDMDMDMSMDDNNPEPTLSEESEIVTSSTSVNWDEVSATPWNGHMHGVPILDTKLSIEQQKYWNSYNTTTYLTIDTPYKSYLHIHLFLLFISAFVFYPFVLILNNLESNWYLPLLSIQSSLSIISCIFYSIFINNVPDLYPNMVYSKLINGLFILTILQVLFSIIFTVKRWLYPNNQKNCLNSSFSTPILNNHKGFQSLSNFYDDNTNNIPMDSLSSPASTLFEIDNDNDNDNDNYHTDTDSFNLENGNPDTPTPPTFIKNSSKIVETRNEFLEKLSSSLPLLSFLASKFGLIFTILHNITIWSLFIYFLILLPTGIACLNLFGQGPKVFNLLAHFIKGGIFFSLGLLSLARYCGCFAGIGGAWNYAYVNLNSNIDNNYINSGINGKGSGGSNVSQSIWIRFHRLFLSKNGGLICSFEFVESLLIFIYGASNVFLEHLASTDGVWSAKDLQHVSIAFMYFGAGLCGLIAESKLSSWRRSLFFNTTVDQLLAIENTQLDENLSNDDKFDILSSNKLITPGFSPNLFPVFTIFWTGILMSKHAQPSALSTEIHVQWGSLLTYGSFFRVLTFFLMSYYPIKNSKQCFSPSKPITELVTSFCLLCGGLVFMESTDQVIEALAYRGLTSMFTINVSVGVISLIMAWTMFIFAIKDKLQSKMIN